MTTFAIIGLSAAVIVLLCCRVRLTRERDQARREAQRWKSLYVAEVDLRDALRGELASVQADLADADESIERHYPQCRKV